jgi:hypothetical protein
MRGKEPRAHRTSSVMHYMIIRSTLRTVQGSSRCGRAFVRKLARNMTAIMRAFPRTVENLARGKWSRLSELCQICITASYGAGMTSSYLMDSNP